MTLAEAEKILTEFGWQDDWIEADVRRALVGKDPNELVRLMVAVRMVADDAEAKANDRLKAATDRQTQH